MIEVGYLHLARSVAAWVSDHLDTYQAQGRGYADAVADLLTTMHGEALASQERHRRDHEEIATAAAQSSIALTDEQQRVHDTEQAFLHIGFGMADIEAGLAIAARLGLPVRWSIDGTDVPAPARWPRPELADIPSAFDWPPGFDWDNTYPVTEP